MAIPILMATGVPPFAFGHPRSSGFYPPDPTPQDDWWVLYVGAAFTLACVLGTIGWLVFG